MRIIDITNSSKSVLHRDINRLCGGTLKGTGRISWRQSGVGGFTFYDGIQEGESVPYKVNLAFFVRGLGIYFRNRLANRLMLLPEEEISAIRITGTQDVIQPARLSLYRFLRATGFSHEKAAPYLMPVEIIRQDGRICRIHVGDTYVELQLTGTGADRVYKAFAKSCLHPKTTYEVPPTEVR